MCVLLSVYACIIVYVCLGLIMQVFIHVCEPLLHLCAEVIRMPSSSRKRTHRRTLSDVPVENSRDENPEQRKESVASKLRKQLTKRPTSDAENQKNTRLPVDKMGNQMM